MDIIWKIMDKRKFRLFGAAALILVFYSRENFTGWFPNALMFGILTLEIIILLLPDKYWTTARYLILWCAVILLFLLFPIAFSIHPAELLWPLVWVLGRMDSRYKNLSMTLAALTACLILMLSYPDQLPLQTLLALFGVYIGIRSLRIRQEAYRLSLKHQEELNQSLEELREAHEELQQAAVQMLGYAALEERSRISREIHDGIGHQLTSLIVQLQALKIMLKNDPQQAENTVSELLDTSRQAMAEVRMAVRDWREDERGLGLTALKSLVNQTRIHSGLKIEFRQETELSEWQIEVSIVLYRILQEALTNILKHAQAEKVAVSLRETDNHVILTIQDDGKFITAVQPTAGIGVKGMAERAASLNGTFRISAADPCGCVVEAVLPLYSSEKDFKE